MKQRISYILRLISFWMVYFLVIRAMFFLYSFSFTRQTPTKDVLYSFIYGLKLDISLTAYFLFFIILIITLLIPFDRCRIGISMNKWVLRFCNLFLITISSIISIIDIELYRNWGFRIDNTVLLYIESPKESLASTPSWLFLLLLVLVVFLVWITYIFYKKFVERALIKLNHAKWYYIPVFLLLPVLLIIPIRGGIGIAPINQGAVYFSKYQFANHAALNVLWNFGKSVIYKNDAQSVNFMSDDEANKNYNSLFSKNSLHPIIIESTSSLIKPDKPNIVIIILESFTASVVESVGGLPNVTPELNKLSHEGILFSNFYANGDRSDKGIVSILSGYPAQPTASIIKNSKKTEKLPFLSKELEKMDYSTGFYYGGDINFANMNSYFVIGGYDTIVSLDAYDKSELSSKWGAHDHITFNKFFEDINDLNSPFFRVMFTLSSHEPYDVPHKSKFYKSDANSRFLNSIHYTDSCLGDFIQKAKQTAWWNNTWFILVADHGSRLPGNTSYSSKRKFKIPMLWLGGSVITDTIINKTASQIDIPLMIGNQLGKDFSSFNFSKDILNGQNGFAFYSYNNGFGFVNDTSSYIWNNISHRFVINNKASPQTVNQGKAFLQKLLIDYNNK